MSFVMVEISWKNNSSHEKIPLASYFHAAKIQNTMSEENFISGVHNYCDRWCERCRFVERCEVGASEKLADLELQMALAENEEEQAALTTDFLHDTFTEIQNMLLENAEELGIDLNAAMEAADNEPAPEPSEAQQKLEELARSYAGLASDWVAENQVFFQPGKIYSALMTHPGNDPAQLAENIKAAFDTLQWFNFFIAAKVNRAIHGAMDHWEELDPVQNDWNGSAKIALLATEQCIQAWEALENAFPDLSDSILPNLALLDKIKRGILVEFPQAMDFVRPGFDEPEHNT
jgi:hypothetical protein